LLAVSLQLCGAYSADRRRVSNLLKLGHLGLERNWSLDILECGLGVTAGIKPGLTVNGEFVSYLSEDDYSYSGFNFGLSKLF
jgi:hypothetical protein